MIILPINLTPLVWLFLFHHLLLLLIIKKPLSSLGSWAFLCGFSHKVSFDCRVIMLLGRGNSFLIKITHLEREANEE